MNGEPSETRTRIAILGGGIAGSTAAVALSSLPDLDVELFDAASELREIGASIALQPCALRCLEKMGLGEGVERLGYRFGEHPLVHRHWRTGEIIDTPLPDPLPLPAHQMARFYRPHLHTYLLSHLSPQRIHLRKRVVSLSPHQPGKDGNGGITVHFEDGTTWSGDAVIAADGIRSAVRQWAWPEYRVEEGDLVTLRGAFEIPTADEGDGASSSSGVSPADWPKESCHWIGEDRQFFTSPLKGDLFAVVAFLPKGLISPSESSDATTGTSGTSTNTTTPDVRVVSAPQAEWGKKLISSIQPFYSTWHPLIQSITSASPPLPLYPDYHGPPLPTLVPPAGEGRVVLIGDAGHCHGGAFAAGGTTAIEDAYTLYLGFERALEVQSRTSTTAAAGRLTGEKIASVMEILDECRLSHVNRLCAAAETLREQRRAAEGRMLTDLEIEERVHKRQDVAWLAENDTEGVFLDVVRRRASRGLDI